MKLPDRMLILETELKYIKKLMYVILVVLTAELGVEMI